ncbi:MAG: hypothetical protein HND53_11690 [Proteobacteria bacterium]|nr:hypothetical protein [Pseudomonadota bacterium]
MKYIFGNKPEVNNGILKLLIRKSFGHIKINLMESIAYSVFLATDWKYDVSLKYQFDLNE